MGKRTIFGIVLAIVIGVLVFFLNDNQVNKNKNNGYPPPVPPMVSASPGVQQITLTWQPVNGATSYNIYWSRQPAVTKSNGEKITCTDRRYVHTGLSGGTTYYYIVTALNAFGESLTGQEVPAVAKLPYSETESAEPVLKNSTHQSERPRVESPETDQQTWFPEDEVPPPWEEWPGTGEPTWDPNEDKPPPQEEWPGEGETPKWSPHDEPQRMKTPF